MENNNFEKVTFSKRLKGMLKVDFRRLFRSRFFYILIGICLVMPILILVMTTMMDGTVSKNPETGEETVVEGFDNVWQIIGTVSGDMSAGTDMSGGAGMSLTSMCNINMLYFAIAVLVCVFVCDDFRSGYSKNLFTVRAKKSDYVISKTLACTLGGALMVIAFFIGSMLGGAISSLPFDIVGFGAGELIMCLISKLLLVSVFVPIYLVMSVVAKQKSWLAMCLSFAVGMLLFMMIPMLTPLNASFMNIILCLGGGALFSVGLGAISNTVLNKTALV